LSAFDDFKKHFGPRQRWVGYLATADGTRPTVRPVTFFLSGRRLCFCTGAQDAKVKQLRANAAVEVLLPFKKGRYGGYYRITGSAEILTDAAGRRRILRKAPFATEGYWEGPQDPRLAVVVVHIKRARYLPPGAGAIYEEPVDLK